MARTKHKVSISRKIKRNILGFMIFGVISIALVAFGSSWFFSENSANTSSGVLLDEELDNLNRLVKQKAIVVNEYFKEYTSQVEYLAGFASDLFNDRIPAIPRRNYYGDLDVATVKETPPLVYSEKHKRMVSFNYSAWYFPNISLESECNASVISLVNKSSNLDFVFKILFDENPSFLWAYMGFENGMHRTYPYKNLSSWKTLVFTNAWTGEPTTPYDPRLRQFYHDAVVSQDLSITKPYLDPTGAGLKISISHPIYYDNGTLVGCLGADLTINAVEQTVNNLQILDSGYAFMIDTDANAIIHHSIDRGMDSQMITELEFGSNHSSDAIEFNSILDDMTRLNIGNDSFIKNGQKWYISYYPIFEGDFCLALTVPERDVLQPAVNIQNQIYLQVTFQMLWFILLIVIVSSVVLLATSHFSHELVEPIRELTNAAEQIARGNYDVKLRDKKSGSKEITLLFNTFKGLITAVRFGNESYYAGNLNRAMENYTSALQLFTTLDNQKGIGICHNNIGNIQRIKGNLMDAKRSYIKAIEIGEKLLRVEEDKKPIIFALASRYNNLGLLFKSLNDYEASNAYLQKALEMDEKINNIRGFAIRYGNLGQLYLEQNDIRKAKECFDMALDIAEKNENERALAYAMMNFGVYEKIIGNLNFSIQNFLKAAEFAVNLDVRVVTSCWKNIREIYLELGNQDMARKMEEKIRFISGIIKQREIVFVLDYSGSMAGKKNISSLNGIKKIFNEQIKPNDFVSLIIFNDKIKKIFHLIEKEGNEENIMELINKLRRPESGTAFYDALGLAIEILSERKSQSEKWIISLTDGDDTWSSKYNINSIIQAFQESVKIELVIIGVGDLKDREMLKNICESSDRGKYLNVKMGLNDAIGEAYEEVSVMLSEVEVEGFVPDY
ncbi:MAG: VWA domain-containing protein [Candidatus Hodarchaeota archaeon]